MLRIYALHAIGSALRFSAKESQRARQGEDVVGVLSESGGKVSTGLSYQGEDGSERVEDVGICG